MIRAIEVDGKRFTVFEVITGDKARYAQICPKHSQINYGKSAPHIALTVPDHMLTSARPFSSGGKVYKLIIDGETNEN